MRRLLYTIIFGLLFNSSAVMSKNIEIHESIVILQYKEAIRNVISHIWYKQDYFKKGWFCEVTITQGKRGRVRKKSDISCNTLDEGFVISVEDAVSKITRLPKARKVFFEKEIQLVFYHND